VNGDTNVRTAHCPHGAVGVGCEVLIRSVRPEGQREVELPLGLQSEIGDQVITVVADTDEMGLYRVTTRTPLGRALLGHRVGDVVSVRTQACVVSYEVVAVDAPTAAMSADAGLAEQVDAAVLKIAPVEGPGSSPGAGTTLDPGLRLYAALTSVRVALTTVARALTRTRPIGRRC